MRICYLSLSFLLVGAPLSAQSPSEKARADLTGNYEKVHQARPLSGTARGFLDALASSSLTEGQLRSGRPWPSGSAYLRERELLPAASVLAQFREPKAPRPGHPSLLFDFRAGSTMPKGHGGGFATAGNFKDVLAAIGSGHYNNGWGATANVDGRGTVALMGTYGKATSCNAQQEKKANLKLVRPARHVVFSYMTRLGRSPTGDGMAGGAPAKGKVNAYRAQSAHCEGKGGKRLRFVQARVTMPDGSKREPIISHQWRGGAVGTDVRGDISGEPGAQLFSRSRYSPQEWVGRPVRVTVELRASSAPSGRTKRYERFTPDGVIRMWVDGTLVFDGSDLRIGSSPFTRINLMSRLNSPSFDMTDYWWDMVAYEIGN